MVGSVFLRRNDSEETRLRLRLILPKFEPGPLTARVSREDYDVAFGQVREALSLGDNLPSEPDVLS